MKNKKEIKTIEKEVEELKAEELSDVEKLQAKEVIKRLGEITEKWNLSEDELARVRGRSLEFARDVDVLKQEKTQLSKQNKKLQEDVDRLCQCLTDTAIGLLEMLRKTL